MLQPLAIAYTRRNGMPVDPPRPPVLAWYGDMDLAPHLAPSCSAARSMWRSPGASRSRSTETARRPPQRPRRRSARPSMRHDAPAMTERSALAGEALLTFCNLGRLGFKRAVNWSIKPPRSSRDVAFEPAGPPPVKKVFVKSYGCQMNVYDAERMADILAAEGYAATATHGGCRSRHPQHLPYPREGGRKGLFRARPRARAEDRARSARAAETQVVVAGCVAQAEGAEILRRAPVGRRGGRPAELSPPAGALASAPRTRRVVDTEFPIEDKFDHLPAPTRAQIASRAASPPSSPFRKAATSSAPSASCPIRAARRSRGRSRGSRRGERLADAGVRETHADRPERQRLSRRRARRRRLDPGRLLAPPRRDPRHRAPALHHEPSARHGRRR